MAHMHMNDEEKQQSEEARKRVVGEKKGSILKDSAVSWAEPAINISPLSPRLLRCCPCFLLPPSTMLLFRFCYDFPCRRTIKRAIHLMVNQTGYYSDSRGEIEEIKAPPCLKRRMIDATEWYSLVSWQRDDRVSCTSIIITVHVTQEMLPALIWNN